MGPPSSFFTTLVNDGRVAVVGVAKNCGKTTTLNFLLEELPKSTMVGLLSIGVDGEGTDALLGTPKPRIRVRPGHWVVTSRVAMLESRARVEYVESLGIETPMGEVFVGRVLDEGFVVLAGLRHRQDLAKAVNRLEHYGVELTLIDGAYGRVAGAHSELVRGVIFATGAVIANSPEKIVKETEDLLCPWELPVVEDTRHWALIEQALEEERALLGDVHGSVHRLSHPSALIGLARGTTRWEDATDALAVPGLVSDRIVEELLTLRSIHRTLIVPCPTSIHVESALWRRFTKSWQVRVLRSSAIKAISFNPTAVQGHRVDGGTLREQLKKRWPEYEVFDPSGVY